MDEERRSRADARRNQSAILEAALGVLAADPQAPMSAVADAAGVSRMTVYRHFPTRSALHAAVARHQGAIVGPLLDAMAELPLREAFARLAAFVVGLGVEYRSWLADASLDELARVAVADEPMLPWLQRRRGAGDVTSTLPDRWLAVCVRRLAVTALQELALEELTAAEIEHALSDALFVLATTEVLQE